MTRRALALRLLREAGSAGVTTDQFLDGGVGSRYSARIHELRDEGHNIRAQRLRDGQWRYKLVPPLMTLAEFRQERRRDAAQHGELDDNADTRPALFDDAERGTPSLPAAHAAKTDTHLHGGASGASRPSGMRLTGPHGEELV